MTKRSIVATFISAIALCATTALASGCVETGRMYVRLGPPTPIVDVRGVAPGPGYLWIEGYHRWDGRAYVWTAGRWELPPRGHNAWVQGHWAHDGHGWYYVQGHWR